MAITKFHKPSTLQECLRLKADLGPEAVLLAGGTDVLVHLHEGKLKGSEIIDLTGVVELKHIETDGKTYSVGAGVTFTEAAVSSDLVRYQGLVEACKSVGSPQIRNAGTVGGNIANGSPAADSAPPLMALDGIAVLAKEGAERRVPLTAFYTGKGSTVLESDEVLTAITFPALPENAVIVFEKLGLRNALAISRISLALYVEAENGCICQARVASGSIGLSPMRESALEEFLTGKPLNDSWLNEGMALFSEQIAQRLSGRGTMPYKRVAVQGVFENAVRKALNALSERSR